MADLDTLLASFDGMVADVQAQVASEMQITAATGVAKLIDRVTETGKDAEGASFRLYTPEYELYKRGASSAKLTKKKKTAEATKDKPIGRYKGFVDFTLTGRMFDNTGVESFKESGGASVGVTEQYQEGGKYVVRVGARSDENRLKMLGNDEQRPGFFRLCKVEQADMAGDAAKRMVDWAVKFLAR